MAGFGELTIKRLGADDIALMRGINALYADAFEAPRDYPEGQPDDDYLRRHLADPNVIALAALAGDRVVGALTGYVLPKLEQARSELYIYDLAVAEDWRRKGAATALIEATKAIGQKSGAWVIFVQVDYGDDPAVALYTKLGAREEVMHFDIQIGKGEGR
jgi:aminoglycoside 3-N-acetyltransferase I